MPFEQPKFEKPSESEGVKTEQETKPEEVKPEETKTEEIKPEVEPEKKPEAETSEGEVKKGKEEKVEDWYDRYRTLYDKLIGDVLGKEELKKIDQQVRQELAFEEFEEKLAKDLETEETRKGEKLSEEEKILEERDAYLDELGYSVKERGLPLDKKIEIFNEKGQPLCDEKGKPVEFRALHQTRDRDRQVNDFLKEKVREKIKSKLEKELTEEEKLESGRQKAVKEAQDQQKKREAEIFSQQKDKKADKEKIEKTIKGLSSISSISRLKELGVLEIEKR